MVNNLTERELKILSYLIDEDDFINGDVVLRQEKGLIK